MLDIMMMSKNAIEAYNSKLKTTAANIANLEVVGYKRLSISFQSIFERVLRQGTAASPITEAGGTNPFQLGSGVSIGSVGLDFSQGDFADSTSGLSLAIQGSGLFIVSADGGETMLYTRNGEFEIVNGNLVTKNGGMQVYGLNNAGGLVPITGLDAYTPSSLSWESSTGRLALYSDPGTWTTKTADTTYRIALTSFGNLSGLQQSSGTTFAETVASGPSLDPQTSSGTYGIINPRKLEKSNVFLTSETIDSLAAQQALNGNLSILRSINEEITNFINRIG